MRLGRAVDTENRYQAQIVPLPSNPTLYNMICPWPTYVANMKKIFSCIALEMVKREKKFLHSLEHPTDDLTVLGAICHWLAL